MRNRRGHALWVTVLVGALVFAGAFFYRFNGLGGALGGFDNDHFLHLAYAEQVQAGSQPLRDFLDSGLQGARPSLTYELSAAAQGLFGQNLRAEALLTTGATALGAVFVALAAWRLVPLPWALVTTALAVFVSSKLYGYPKVLVLAGAAWLFVRYAAQPTWRVLMMLAAWAAMAFLFRHDYAAYVGLGASVLLLTVHRSEHGTALARIVGLTLMVGVLLSPSLLWIQRYAGIGPYLGNALDMGRREAERTDISWPTIDTSPLNGLSGWFELEANAEAWLYYLFLSVPLLALLLVWRQRRALTPTAPALLAIAVMSVAVNQSFLRGSLEARFGDAAAPVAVLGAAVIVGGPRRPGRFVIRGLRFATVAVILTGTTGAVWALGSVRSELGRSGLTRSPMAVARQAARVSNELGALPAAAWTEADPTPSVRAAQYLHQCTRPNDRILIMSYAPELLVLADRRFAGGRATTIPGFYEAAAYERVTMSRLRQESVPIVLTEDGAIYEDDYPASFPLLHAYLQREYEEAGALDVNGGHRLRVFARRGVPPASRFGRDGWPCFGGRE